MTLKNLSDKLCEICGESKIIDVFSVVSQIGEFQNYVVKISQFSNQLKLEQAWYCISEDLDVEKSINEIYNYVSDKDRAFYISNEFRKIILSTSLLSSSIIAYIMGIVVRENRKCTHEEAIISNALINMTDYDLNNIIYLCSECVGNLGGREVITIDESKGDVSSYYYTLQLCVGNGLFKIESDFIGEDMDEDSSDKYGTSLYAGLHYIKNGYTDKLLEYIDKVKQLLRYGDIMQGGLV